MSRRLVVLAAACAMGAFPPGAAASSVKPTQELASLLSPRKAFSGPSRTSSLIALVAHRRPLTGERTALPVLGSQMGADGFRWMRVRLPGRPNGLKGWIRQQGTTRITTSWHIVVHTLRPRAIFYRNGRKARTVRAIVGKSATPTPHGEFFVEESVRLRARDAGAPFALALSARSNVLQEFAGGPGQIALHGRGNLGGILGTAVSHGCVRLADDAIRWLAARIRVGVPVTLTS